MKRRNIYNKSDKKGAGVCRNIGMSIAQGKWLLFADSDDYFLKDWYDKVRKFLDSDSEIIYFTPTSIQLDTNKLSQRHVLYEQLIRNYKEDTKKNEKSLRTKFVVPWSKLIKRSLVEKNEIQFSETLVYNDMIFSTKTGLASEKIEVSDEKIYCVTEAKGSLTKKVNVLLDEVRIDVFIEYYTLIREKLGKKELKNLKIEKPKFILNSFYNKFGIKYIIKIYMKFRKNKIQVFNLKSLNLYKQLKRRRDFIKNKRSQERYITKN